MNFDKLKQQAPDQEYSKQDVAVPKMQYFKMMALSIDDADFFYIKDLQEAFKQSQNRLQNTEGNYRIIPALFYHLLDATYTLPKRIFFSYSHKDALYRHELETHFAGLKRSGLVETWCDMEIHAGDEWDSKILNEIKNADIILLLLSADFMNSSYIWENEIPAAVESGKIIIPIFLRPCDFNIGEFRLNEAGNAFNMANIQGVPFDRNGTGIQWIIGSQWQYRDEAYLKVIEKIKEVLKQA